MTIFTAIGSWIAYNVAYAAASVGIASAATIGTVAGYVAAAVASAAVSRMLQPNVSIPKQQIQAVINQVDEPRRIYVGQYLAGGIRALFETSGNTLYQLVVVAQGALTEFKEFWIDGEKVTLDAAGLVTSGRAAGHVRSKTHSGVLNGGDYSALSVFSYWGASRRLENQATFLVEAYAPKAKFFNKIFPKSYNTLFQWVIRGQAVYDNRTGLTVYSDNAALVIAHYLRHDDGYKLPSDEMDWPSVNAMADVADLAIPSAAGGTKPNLRLWGYWTLDEGPIDVLDRMHASSGIRAYETQSGKIGLIGGPFGTPACTITGKDIKSIQTSEAINEREGYNVLRLFHLSAKQNYEIIEAEPWKDTARLAQEGEITKEYRMEMCPDLSQARRLGKEQIHDDNRAKVTIVTNAVGLKARFPRQSGQRHTINLDYRPEDGSGRVIAGEYEVLDHEFNPIEMECRIELAKVDRASAAWTTADEGETIADLPARATNPPPAISATLTQRVQTLTAGLKQAILEIDVVPIAGRTDLSITAEFRKVGNTSWRQMTAVDFSATSGAVEDGQQYDARVRFEGVFDGIDDWLDMGPITIQIESNVIAAPTEFFVSNGTGGKVNLNWRNPNEKFHRINVYRNTVNNITTATFIGDTGGVAGQISEFTDTTAAAATDYKYYVRAVNSSGVLGYAVGPVSIITP